MLTIMAYKKKVTELETSNTENTKVVETEVNEVPAEMIAEETKVEDPKSAVTPNATKKETESEIPAFALGLLKIFNDYPALYINEKGCVYASQPPENMGAILYKNPFYKH